MTVTFLRMFHREPGKSYLWPSFRKISSGLCSSTFSNIMYYLFRYRNVHGIWSNWKGGEWAKRNKVCYVSTVYTAFTSVTCLYLEHEDEGHGGGPGQSQRGLLWLKHCTETQGKRRRLAHWRWWSDDGQSPKAIAVRMSLRLKERGSEGRGGNTALSLLWNGSCSASKS